MHPVDWTILIVVMVWIVYDGLKRTTDSGELEGYFLAKRSIPWWAAGLSVMATQLSAITMVGTTGQGYTDGLRFVQMYYGLPLAMIILSIAFVPFFYRAKVYTAYEYLEQRFDAKTRSLTSFLFLVSRGMSCGVIISAPAVVMSIILGLDITATAMLIGLPAIIYTIFGGVQAVTWTDVKIMVLIIGGLIATLVTLAFGLPDQIALSDALNIAGATGRLEAIDFKWNPNETYSFWSGTIGGLFLMLSYFGADQSQVQRYLTAKSVHAARHSLLMSAYYKIPLQLLVLMVGIFIYLFYIFSPPPLLFNRTQDERLRASGRAAEYQALEQRFTGAIDQRRQAAEQLATAERSDNAASIAFARSGFSAWDGEVRSIRQTATTMAREVSGDRNYSDTNYVFPRFILTQLPIGLIGLLMVAIILAATDSIAAELNSLSTATVIDFYRRYVTREATDAHYLKVSKYATAFWGVFASLVAIWAAELGSLIEVVNRFGSFFYGSILGVFLLAFLWRRAHGTAAFIALIIGMVTVAWFAFNTGVSFLWHNVIGAVTVFVVGIILSALLPGPRPSDPRDVAKAA
ncbi:MAG TPA: sodium:solute symporter [Vicinamibacterales bacterium]|nr:sodium:solute symporter [Vicinamibacterales bacterium]